MFMFKTQACTLSLRYSFFRKMAPNTGNEREKKVKKGKSPFPTHVSFTYKVSNETEADESGVEQQGQTHCCRGFKNGSQVDFAQIDSLVAKIDIGQKLVSRLQVVSVYGSEF